MNIEKIVNDIINYDNKDNLSWIQVYKKITNNLSDEEKNRILLSVVKSLSKLGYDIVDNPFKLTKFL